MVGPGQLTGQEPRLTQQCLDAFDSLLRTHFPYMYIFPDNQKYLRDRGFVASVEKQSTVKT